MTTPASMTCEEALALLAELIDAELGADQRQAVEHHLEACRSCYSRAEFERRFKQRLAQIGRRDVDAAFEGRIRSLISRFDDTPDAPAGAVD